MLVSPLGTHAWVLDPLEDRILFSHFENSLEIIFSIGISDYHLELNLPTCCDYCLMQELSFKVRSFIFEPYLATFIKHCKCLLKEYLFLFSPPIVLSLCKLLHLTCEPYKINFCILKTKLKRPIGSI